MLAPALVDLDARAHNALRSRYYCFRDFVCQFRWTVKSSSENCENNLRESGFWTKNHQMERPAEPIFGRIHIMFHLDELQIRKLSSSRSNLHDNWTFSLCCCLWTTSIGIKYIFFSFVSSSCQLQTNSTKCQIVNRFTNLARDPFRFCFFFFSSTANGRNQIRFCDTKNLCFGICSMVHPSPSRLDPTNEWIYGFRRCQHTQTDWNERFYLISNRNTHYCVLLDIRFPHRRDLQFEFDLASPSPLSSDEMWTNWRYDDCEM